MATRYYTRKRDIKLKAGQTVGYTKGKGYYIKPAPAKKKTAAKVAPKKKPPVKRKPTVYPGGAPTATAKPTSAAPNRKAGKKQPVARAVAKVRAKVVKARHAVAPTAAAKHAMVTAFAKWGVAHQTSIHYAEIRPVPQVTPGRLPALPFTTDCSGFATMAYQYAGLPDPNGNGYDNGRTKATFTGSLLKHGRHVPSPAPADVVIYGGGTGHHAAVAITAARDPLTVSHGSEAGPLLITVSEETRYQPPGITYLTFPT